MRTRLVAVLVGLTATVLAAHDVPLALHLRTVEHDRIVTGLQRDAFTLGGRAEERLERGATVSVTGLQGLVDAYRQQSGARVLITDRDGRAVLTSDEESRAGADYSTRPEVAQALAGTLATGRRSSRTLGTDLLYVAAPVRSGDDILGAVRLTFPASVVDRRVASRVRGLVGVAAISLLAAMGAAVLLAGTVSRPLRRLRAATERLADGDMDVRAVDDDGPSDVRSLASSFNTMTGRLATLLRAQQAFAGDASHQLRTPLTALRLRLEQASELVEDRPDEARLRIEAASTEAERLQHLVRQLLLLARVEGQQPERVTVDLAAVAAERREVWEPLAADQGVELRLDAPGRAPVSAVTDAAEQVVDTYLDNALAVAPAGSVVELVVRAAGPDTVVEVRDRGAGLEADELERAFDRFWRGRDATPDGSGLGLAIVAQLVRVSGGRAALARRDGGGLVASATFRTAEDAAGTTAGS